MREQIIEKIKLVESQFDVRVCLAVESGSRAWGFSSENSDYDVRFIYVHKRDWYLSIEQKQEVIELPIQDFVDMSGWELRKALRLYKKSNPHILEWIHSEIVYYQVPAFLDKMLELEDMILLPQSVLYHYLNMAKRNSRDFIRGETVKVKKYLNVLRPVLACKWIERFNTVPPIELQVLIDKFIDEGRLKHEIQVLLARKISGDKDPFELKLDYIDEYMAKEIHRLEEYVKTLVVSKEDATQLLDDLFRNILDEAWTEK